MQFSDSTNEDGIVEDVVWRLGGDPSNGVADIEDLTLKDIAREANKALDLIEAKIMQAQDIWTWDSTEYNNMPRARGDLVAGQSEYAIRAEFLTIQRVEIIDDKGNGHKLKQKEEQKINDHSLIEDYKKDNGTPEEYRPMYKTLFLSPAPDFDKEKGLIIYFQRTGERFTATGNDDRTPGFASLFHPFIPAFVALQYAKKNSYSATFISEVKKEMKEITNDIFEHFGNRANDEPQQATVHSENYGESMMT